MPSAPTRRAIKRCSGRGFKSLTQPKANGSTSVVCRCVGCLLAGWDFLRTCLATRAAAAAEQRMRPGAELDSIRLAVFTVSPKLLTGNTLGRRGGGLGVVVVAGWREWMEERMSKLPGRASEK